METRPETPASQAYTVVSGDNLWKIARRFYGGGGSSWKKIYDANAAVIEETAKKCGKTSSDNGHWIYPGCILTIPYNLGGERHARYWKARYHLILLGKLHGKRK